MMAIGYSWCFLLGAAVLAAGVLLERLSGRWLGQHSERKRRETKELFAEEGNETKGKLEKELLNFLRYDGTEQQLL